MNFLAHLALSGSREDVLMGNFTGDYAKGRLTPKKTEGWSADYLAGVKLHRFIDHFTDTHPATLAARRVLSQSYPKVGAVALDIFFDYFLARHFTLFHHKPLPEFAARAYAVITRRQALIPAAMVPMAEAMIAHDWLTHYCTVEGIGRAFSGLARRFTFMAAIRGAEHEMILNQSIYEEAFLAFYPELMAASRHYRQQLTHYFDD